ncbi:DmpA family aminopeptidase [Fusibacter bizertensis]
MSEKHTIMDNALTYNDWLERFGFKIGKGVKGTKNTITDVEGVKVGHYTLSNEQVQTGITAILPHGDNLFREKLIAATYVMNGFGKSIGLMQIDELGTIETPILMTNTLSVGRVATGLVRYMLEQNPDIGVTAGSVNPVVCECNDGYLNEIRGLHLQEEDVFKAIERCEVDFEQGAVGAGTGMMAYNLKGGIGSSSRVVEFGGKMYTIGILVLSNFGRLNTFQIDGHKVGEAIKFGNEQVEQGSMIAILATDLPLNERQLKRTLKRIPAGMARTGAHFGNGSGDVFFGFSTARRVNYLESEDIIDIKAINENRIDRVFNAAIEATEEAILNSMFYARTTTGKDGRCLHSIMEYDELIK